MEMMSKKKKDKSDEPKKTKTKSSKKASPDLTSATAGVAPVAAGGSTARPKPRRTAAAKKTVAFEISADDIALRAYYIAEHRRNLKLPGDELGDWVEAERQLRKESVKKSA
jgi:hypothetical protein